MRNLPNPNDLTAWIAGKPGPFSARTVDAVWTLAFKNFGDCGYEGGRGLSFTMAVGQLGFEVRSTAFGGFVLDAKQ